MIRATSLRGFDTLVAELGGDPSDYLRRFGIDQAALTDDSDRVVPITAHDLMLDTAARELRCPDLGLRLAQRQDLTILGPLALAIESSTTVGEAVECASRFLFVHSPALRISVEADPLDRRGVVALVYRKDLRESAYSPQGIELGLGLLHRVAVSLVGEARVFRSVLIPHAPLSPVQHYLDHFGTDVRFGGAVPALCGPRELLDERFADADETIRAAAIAHLTQQFRDPHLTLSARVRLSIAESLQTSRPTIGDVARLFALHPRTLERRLRAEGTTFAALLDEVRREAAQRYLLTTDLPIGQIALLIGYREQSTFNHAMQRWHGVSPGEFRRATRQED